MSLNSLLGPRGRGALPPQGSHRPVRARIRAYGSSDHGFRRTGYPRTTEDSLKAAGQALPDGLSTRRTPTKGFRFVFYISCPFPKLAWRNPTRRRNVIFVHFALLMPLEVIQRQRRQSAVTNKSKLINNPANDGRQHLRILVLIDKVERVGVQNPGESQTCKKNVRVLLRRCTLIVLRT